MTGLLRHPWVIRLAQIGIGVAFAWAGLAKIGNLKSFASEIQHFEMLPVAITHLMAMTLPWIELVAGVALILNLRARASAWLVAALMVVFTIAVGTAAARGLTIECGCFGSADPQPVGLKKVLTNLGLTAAAVVAGLRPR